MKYRGEIRRERRRMKGRRGEVEMRRKGNEGDRTEETMKTDSD
jgi:hypothetical protein